MLGVSLEGNNDIMRVSRLLPPILAASMLLLTADPALAQEAPPATTLTLASALPTPPPPRNWFVHANLAVNAFTWLGETSTQPSRWIGPGDRFILLQQLGVGRWVHPNVRLQLTLQFVETLSGLGPNESALSLYGAIPWVVFTYKRFFVGTGVLLAARSGGKDQFDAGWFTGLGVTFPLSNGWALAAAVQAPVMFVQRLSVAVSPALIVSYRF